MPLKGTSIFIPELPATPPQGEYPQPLALLIQLWNRMLHTHESALALEKSACSIPVPNKLRPATPADIVPGAMIWYPHRYGSTAEQQNSALAEGACLWVLVIEVLQPGTEGKAFYGWEPDFGASGRYLEGAFVEDKEKI